ncbi:hypothetical protein [uncultured Fibrobacter sp.]|uniref:hypothetical protein n=1 Tax=uncultured Fibrobacter sp. TaxID=261512 RepID=UPI00260ED7DD|nr:hypothetical protein [uncultured Fibrobacter sp.]
MLFNAGELEELISEDDDSTGFRLEELSSDEDENNSVEELSTDDNGSCFFSLEELMFSDDDEFSFFSLDELFSEDEDLSSFTLEELCVDDDSVFLLEELPFTEEDDVLVCFTLDELAFTEDDFAELEEVFSLLEDSTSCSREELDSTNSGWVDELLELSSPQDTNRQTALNGINNRFNMDIRSLLQVLIDQYILIFRLFTPTGPKMPSKGAKKRPLRPPKITQLYKLQLADLFF